MPDLLIVSRDPDVCDTVAKLGVESGLRSKFVHNIAQGEQWIETRRLAAVLVDASFEVEEYQRISESLWKTAPMALLGIFDLNESVERTWDYALLGLEIFDGPNVLELLGRSLRLVARTSVGDDDSISILVVEDLDSPRDIICTYVENMGFTVHGVSSANEALEELKRVPDEYFCVLTDINMPKVSGKELIQQIRLDDRLKTLPIVVLTAYGTADNLIECLEAGATGFLVKPPPRKQLNKELTKAKRIYSRGLNPCLVTEEGAQQVREWLLEQGFV